LQIRQKRNFARTFAAVGISCHFLYRAGSVLRKAVSAGARSTLLK
jgi:hypothetical protein